MYIRNRFLIVFILFISILLLLQGIKFLLPTKCSFILCANNVEFKQPKRIGTSYYRVVKGVNPGRIKTVGRYESGSVKKETFCEKHQEFYNSLFYKLFNYIMYLLAFPIYLLEKIGKDWGFFTKYVRYYYIIIWSFLIINNALFINEFLFKNNSWSNYLKEISYNPNSKILRTIGRFLFCDYKDDGDDDLGIKLFVVRLLFGPLIMLIGYIIVDER